MRAQTTRMRFSTVSSVTLLLTPTSSRIKYRFYIRCYRAHSYRSLVVEAFNQHAKGAISYTHFFCPFLTPIDRQNKGKVELIAPSIEASNTDSFGYREEKIGDVVKMRTTMTSENSFSERMGKSTPK